MKTVQANGGADHQPERPYQPRPAQERQAAHRAFGSAQYGVGEVVVGVQQETGGRGAAHQHTCQLDCGIQHEHKEYIGKGGHHIAVDQEQAHTQRRLGPNPQGDAAGQVIADDDQGKGVVEIDAHTVGQGHGGRGNEKAHHHH